LLEELRARDEQRLDTTFVPDEDGEDALDAVGAVYCCV
jgi:hypothetical protein